jgi:hypothetical protein
MERVKRAETTHSYGKSSLPCGKITQSPRNSLSLGGFYRRPQTVARSPVGEGFIPMPVA